MSAPGRLAPRVRSGRRRRRRARRCRRSARSEVARRRQPAGRRVQPDATAADRTSPCTTLPSPSSTMPADVEAEHVDEEVMAGPDVLVGHDRDRGPGTIAPPWPLEATTRGRSGRWSGGRRLDRRGLLTAGEAAAVAVLGEHRRDQGLDAVRWASPAAARTSARPSPRCCHSSATSTATSASFGSPRARSHCAVATIAGPSSTTNASWSRWSTSARWRGHEPGRVGRRGEVALVEAPGREPRSAATMSSTSARSTGRITRSGNGSRPFIAHLPGTPCRWPSRWRRAGLRRRSTEPSAVATRPPTWTVRPSPRSSRPSYGIALR